MQFSDAFIQTLTWLIPLPPLLAFALIVLVTNRSKTLSHVTAIGLMGLSWVMSWIVFYYTLSIEHFGEHVIAALSEYMRTLICKDTAYDKFVGGDKAALSEQQQRGLDVFLGKGKCSTCHAPPFFSSAMGVKGGAYFNVGVGTENVPEDKVDVGRMKVSTQATDWAAFKPPSLRNVTRSAPYFHNGSVAKLEDAVKIMAGGGIANKNKSPLLTDTGLTDAERADLIAFLGALECPGTLEEPKLP